MKNCERS